MYTKNILLIALVYLSTNTMPTAVSFGKEHEVMKKVEKHDQYKYLKAPVISVFRIRNILVKMVEVPGEMPGSEHVTKITFENTSTKEFYTSEFPTEKIVKHFSQLHDIIFVSVLPCTDCCASGQTKMYIVRPKKIFIIPFEFNSDQFGCPCYTINVYQATSKYIKREIRNDLKNKKLYCFDQEPDCSNYRIDKDGLIRCSEEKVLTPKRTIETFSIIDISSENIEITKFINEGIPMKYLEHWKASKAIKIN